MCLVVLSECVTMFRFWKILHVSSLWNCSQRCWRSFIFRDFHLVERKKRISFASRPKYLLPENDTSVLKSKKLMELKLVTQSVCNIHVFGIKLNGQDLFIKYNDLRMFCTIADSKLYNLCMWKQSQQLYTQKTEGMHKNCRRRRGRDSAWMTHEQFIIVHENAAKWRQRAGFIEDMSIYNTDLIVC